MSNYNQLLHGSASDVVDLLYYSDPETFDKSDLTAALINAFRRIDRLESQTRNPGE